MSTIQDSLARELASLRTLGERFVAPETEQDRERRRIAVLIVPFVALAIFGAIVPLWEMFKISVSTSQFETTGFSLQAYRTLAKDPVYAEVAWNSLWFGVVTTVVSVALGVAIAHGLEKYDLPREDLLVTLVSFPISLPGIVAAFMMLVLFGKTGMLTNFFAFLSGQEAIDLAIATSVTGLFFGYIYSMIPRATFILRGTYAEVNTAAEEAARALGATPLETFYYVTLPQIRPGVVGALILTFRTALAIFGTVLVLKSLSVVTLRIAREINISFSIQIASAMAAVFFVFTLGFTFLALRYTSAEVGGA
jgi:putative spermidine/putrescine transport system permease protein